VGKKLLFSGKEFHSNKTGRLEYWNDGMMGKARRQKTERKAGIQEYWNDG
jgi:hypothetical protein